MLKNLGVFYYKKANADMFFDFPLIPCLHNVYLII